MTEFELPVLAGDERVVTTLRRMYAREHKAYESKKDELRQWGPDHQDPVHWRDFAFPVRPDQGMLLYLLARSIAARHVVECATSFGHSTIFLAAALRDNGGGRVITTELLPDKADTARQNLADAGLDRYAEVRTGDALTTLATLPAPIDLLLLDGWPGDGESLSLRVLRLLTPSLRPEALVFNDNGEGDYLGHVRDPANGFRTLTLPLDGGGHLSMYDPAHLARA